MSREAVHRLWRSRRQGQAVRSARLVSALALVSLLVALSACGSDDSDADAPATSAKTTTTAADPATGSPVKLGVLSVKGEPEFDDAVEAAVEYLNEEGGGLLGHRIEVHACETDVTPQQGIKCANELVRAGSVAVVLGGDYTADAAFPIYQRAGVPVLEPRVDTNQGLVSPVAVALGPGIPGVLSALAGYAKDTLRGESVVTVSRPAPKAVQAFVDAPLEAAGVSNTWAFFSPENPDFTSTFAAAAAKKPDLILANIDDNAQCVPAMNAIKAMSAEAKVFQIICSDDAVLKAAGALADGELFYAPLDSIAGAESPDAELFAHIMETFSESKSTGYNAAVALSTVMTLAAVLENQGGDAVTKKSILSAFRDSRGVSIFMGPPLECGAFKPYTAMCTASMRVFTVEGGEKKVLTDYISSPDYLR